MNLNCRSCRTFIPRKKRSNHNNSSSLSFLNAYPLPIPFSSMDNTIDSYFLIYFFTPEISLLLWNSSPKISHLLWDSKGTSDPVGRKHSIRSCASTSFLSMTPTCQLFSIVPLLVTFSLLTPRLPFLAVGRCFRT